MMSQSALAAWQCFQNCTKCVYTSKLKNCTPICYCVGQFCYSMVCRCEDQCEIVDCKWIVDIQSHSLVDFFLFPFCLACFPAEDSTQAKNLISKTRITWIVQYVQWGLVLPLWDWHNLLSVGEGIYNRNKPKSIKRAAKTTHIWIFDHNEGSLSLYWQFLQVS